MDPTLTRAAAHKVFGDLYRKSRSPELQEQVDKVIQSVSDVYARIQRIEEIDAQAGKQKGVETAGIKRPPTRNPAASTPKAPVAPRKAEPRRGILGAILGGGDIGVWGKETETLSAGFLGRNLRISQKAVDLFSALNEEQIVSTIKSFRTATREGWAAWEPSIYNTVVAAYQFFSEFVAVAPIFKRVERQESLAVETMKMQRAYALLIQYPNYKKVLNENLVRFISEHREANAGADILRNSMNFMGTMEGRQPTLKNIICAFYGLARKKVVTWQEVLQELQVGKPALDKYRAPEAIMQHIHSTIKKHENMIEAKRADIHEIEEVRSKFFEYDSAGKVRTDFLNPILADVLRRIYPEKLVNEAQAKAHKSEPPKLLYVIMKDFELSTLYLLEGSIHVRDGGNQIEAILFKQGLFRAIIDEFNSTMRDVDVYFRKNKNLTFTFQNFLETLKKENSDEEIRRFVALTRKTNALFKKLLAAFRVIYDNHVAAKQDTNPASQDKLARTRTIPIESISVGKRYIPYYDVEVMSNNRWNAMTVETAIAQIVRDLYNYLFIFRDEELMGHMSSVTKIKAEISGLVQELKKLGVNARED
ncbi:MAG: hypothetical protein JNM27_05285 [Leptospirales bacterium]|nr:hypothetical protein [Leptospirales bacterium]